MMTVRVGMSASDAYIRVYMQALQHLHTYLITLAAAAAVDLRATFPSKCLRRQRSRLVRASPTQLKNRTQLDVVLS